MNLLDTLQDSINEFSAFASFGEKKLTEADNKSAALAEEVAKNQTAIGVNNALAATAKGTSDLNIQNAMLKSAENFGTNLNTATEVLSGLSKQLAQARTTQAAALADVNAKKTVAIQDDPLQWIINQFTVNNDIDKYNAAEKVGDDTAKRITEVNQLTQTTNVTQAQLQTGVTAATIQAAAENAKYLADISASDSQIKALQYNADAIKISLSTSKENLQNIFSLNTAMNSEANISIAQQHLALQRERWNKELELKDLDDSLVKKAVEAGGLIRLGTKVEYTPADMKLVMAQLKSGKPNQFTLDYTNGLQFLTTGVKSYADSPAEALDVLTRGIRINLPGSMEPLKKVLADAATLAKAGKKADGTPLAQPLDPKDTGGFIRLMNQNANDLLVLAGRNIKTGTDNPFEIPSLKSLVNSSSTVANLPIVKKVFGLQIQAGIDFSDPAKMFAATVTALKNNEISYNEAIELSTIFQVGVKANLESRQLTTLGFQPPGDGSWYSYRTKVQTNPGALFGTGDVVDLTKPDMVGRALMKTMINLKINAPENNQLGTFQ